MLMQLTRQGITLHRTIGGWVFSIGDPPRRYRVEKYSRGWWRFKLIGSDELVKAHARSLDDAVKQALTL